MTTAKERYLQFTESVYVPIFFRGWFLDSVCDGKWDVILHDQEGNILGAYVYMIKSKLGLKYILNPQLCPYSGPITWASGQKKEIIKKLKAELPDHSYINQDFWPDIEYSTNTITSQKYTFRILQTEDVDSLFKSLSTDYRRKIRKAENTLLLENSDDFESFIDYAIASFDLKKDNFPYNKSICMDMDKAVLKNGERKIVKCINDEGKIVAQAYFLIDEHWVYNMFNAVDHSYNHHGMNLIIWNEIKSTLDSNKSFDFEGSMIPGVEKFYRKFGGAKTHYSTIEKSNNALVRFAVNLKKQLS